VETVAKRFGRVDVLVNDAAAYPDAPVLEMPVEEWRRVFEVNVTGAFAACQAFGRHCVARGAEGASIVNITTGSVRSPRPDGAAYSASKAALETFSKVLAMELGPHGIRVNVVSPGYIDVRGWSDAFPDRASDDLRARLVRSIPIGRAGRPIDIAHAVLFLCSEAASHISGAALERASRRGRGALRLRAARARAVARRAAAAALDPGDERRRRQARRARRIDEELGGGYDGERRACAPARRVRLARDADVRKGRAAARA